MTSTSLDFIACFKTHVSSRTKNSTVAADIVRFLRTDEGVKTELGKTKCDELAELLERTFPPVSGWYSPSYMGTSFKKAPPVFQWLTEERMGKLGGVEWTAGTVLPEVTDIVSAVAVRDILRELCGSPIADKKDVLKRNHSRKLHKTRSRGTTDKKDTVTYVYTPASPRMTEVNATLFANREAHKMALELLGLFEGRIENTLSSSIKSIMQRVDKIGLLHQVLNEEEVTRDVLTTAVMAQLVSESSYRKAFTTAKQVRGEIPEYLNTLLTTLEGRENTNWLLVASALPYPEYLSRLTPVQLAKLDSVVISILRPSSEFLKIQWDLGVKGSATRGMMVPPRGSGVDSDGWNNVAGGFSSLVRFHRSIRELLGTAPLAITKVLSLTAGDQGQMVESQRSWYKDRLARGEVLDEYEMQQLARFDQLDKQRQAFLNMTRSGTFPWSGVMCEDQEPHFANIRKACVDAGLDAESWLKAPKKHVKAEPSAQPDMICGVVCPVDVATATAMVEFGAFGSKPWGKPSSGTVFGSESSSYVAASGSGSGWGIGSGTGWGTSVETLESAVVDPEID